MRLAQLWSNLWKKNETNDDGMPYSIVLLLRKPHFFTKDELKTAGEKAWNKPFNTQEFPMYFVTQDQSITMMKAGPYLVQLLQFDGPYLEDTEAVLRQLPRAEQKAAWREHMGWAAFDFWSKDPLRKEAYAVLARFSLQLGDENCTAIYIPKDGTMLPNNGSAKAALHKMIRNYPLRETEKS